MNADFQMFVVIYGGCLWVLVWAIERALIIMKSTSKLAALKPAYLLGLLAPTRYPQFTLRGTQTAKPAAVTDRGQV